MLSDNHLGGQEVGSPIPGHLQFRGADSKHRHSGNPAEEGKEWGVSNVGTPVQGGHQPGGGAWAEGRAYGEPRLWLIKVTAGVRPMGRGGDREGEEAGEGGLN